MKLGEIVLEDKNGPDWAVIYIIRDGDELLYIGKSTNVSLRIFQHLGYANPPSGGTFSEYARKSISACWDWDVEYVCVPEDILNQAYRIDYWIKQTEAQLIHDLQPRFNNHYK